MDPNSNDAANKKVVAFEDLPREELIKRCKNLLAIAQKAKQTKDTLQEENNQLKTKLMSASSSGNDDIIERLTQQKLEQATILEELKLLNKDLVNKLRVSEERLATLENENISYKRQNSRLTDENEQLITHLDTLEKQVEEFNRIGLQQQDQLLALEESNKKLIDNTNSQDKIAELQNMLSVSLEELKKQKLENYAVNEKVVNLRLNLTEKDKNINTISNELKLKTEELEGSQKKVSELEHITHPQHSTEELQSTIEKLREKIKFYHSKVVKFSTNVKELKEVRNSILLLFRNYVDQVEEWKTQLTSSALQLIEYINSIKEENLVLKEANIKMIEQLEAHKTDDEKSKEIHQIQTIKVENNRLSDELASLIASQDQHLDEIKGLKMEKDAINHQLSQLLVKHEEEIRVFGDQTRKDSIEIKNKTEENERICIEYRKIISKLEKDIEINLRELDELKSKNSSLQEQLRHLQTNEKEFAEKTSEEIMKLVQENADLSKKLNEKVSSECSETQTHDEDGTDLEETVTTLKRENAEVLAEMNEMNQALKERGETISKLEAHCEEVLKKLQIYETRANKNVDNITQKEEEIKNLQQQLENVRNNVQQQAPSCEEIIVQLKAEIDSLKERLNANLDSSYAESETMSTSTISRTEEGNRLKDLEGSWEERYGKLRNLALKLKGKIRELSGELAKEQSERSDIQQKLGQSAKTIAILQSQCDRLQDDLDGSKNENKKHLSQLDSVAGDISRDKLKLVENDEVLSKLKRELDELRAEKVNTENWKKQIGAKVQALRKELEASKLTIREYESNISKLQADLEVKEQALKTESDCHQQTKNSLEQSSNERKKQSVLNLEMQDYERSVNDLSQKLEKKVEHVNKLKVQVESQKSTISALREQNKIAEERTQDLERDFSSLKLEIQAYKKQIGDFEEVTLQKDDKILNLTRQLESTRSENEELSTELSKVIAEHQKVQNSLRQEKELSRSQSLGLQQNLREAQEALKLRDDELKAVQSDYENYKVRAQSVLRQNQSRDVCLEEKLAEEVSNLKFRVETLTLQLTEAKNNVESLQNENLSLRKDKEVLVNKNLDITEELEDLRSLYDQLSTKQQKLTSEHNETVRGFKVHAETLAQCYRQQLSEAETRHNREVIELQSKIDKAPSPPELFPPLPSMPREEGEGSESVESASKLNSVNPVPLERLLGGDFDQELSYIRKQLGDEESKVMHLTALLADTEQDLAKHVQMNKLLKEEIRRQQRSEEREKHAENLEYLKNVVFKFVTLHSGDERSRMVPVLNTILKLSPEETQKLAMVAKGDPGLRGWLPMWPSPSKS